MSFILELKSEEMGCKLGDDTIKGPQVRLEPLATASRTQSPQSPH